MCVEFTCFTYKYLTELNPLKILKKILIYTFITTAALIGLATALVYIYKDEIIYLATMQINKRLNTKVDVAKKIDISLLEKFPELSIGFHQVKCYEPETDKPVVLASLDKVLITFDVLDFWNKKYTIDKLFLENGFVHLRTDVDGKHNFMILKKDTSNAKSDFAISFIQAKNIDFIYDYRPSEHIYQSYINLTEASLKSINDLYDISIKGDLKTDGIQLQKNIFLKDKNVTLKSSITFNTTSERITIKPSTIIVNTSEFALQGMYDIKKSFLELSFNANKNDVQTFASILPKSLTGELDQYKSSGNVYFNGTIKGITNNVSSPAINIKFGFDNATFYHPQYKQTITDAFLTGTFSNGEKHDMTTSSLKLSDIKLKVDQKVIEGYFHLGNFSNPYIETHLKGGVILSKLLSFIPSHPFEKASGEIDFDVEFKGSANNLKSKDGYKHIQTSGDLVFNNVQVKIHSYPHTISINEAACIFTQNDISIDNMHVAIGKNEIVLNGIFRNLIGKLIFPDQTVFVQADLEMGNIFLEDILMTDTRSVKSSNQDFIMPALKDYKLNLNLTAASMNYHKFHANKITSKIDWSYPYVEFTNANLTFCNGSYTGKTTLKIVNGKSVDINTDSKIRNMDIDSLFYAFENFSQDFLTNKNIKGQISTDISLFMQLDNHLSIQPKSIICDADITVHNGQLNNFEPLKRISKFLDADNLNNVVFSEMSNHFLIYNQEVQIPDMKIVSNVGKISFSGTHNFDGRISYQLAYPIKNLKKEKTDSDAAFGALRKDAKGEMNLFLIIQGTTEEFKITYDKKATSEKIKADMQKEKAELKSLFKKKEQDEIEIKRSQEEQEYFDFDNE